MSMSITITEYDTSKSHVEYTIVVKDIKTGDSFKFQRRYSSLRGLHEQLKRTLKNLPHFPPKKLFGNKNPAFIESRKNQLQEYLSALVNIPDTSSNSYFKEFFSPLDKVPLSSTLQTAQPAAKVASPHLDHISKELKSKLDKIVDDITNNFIDLSVQPNPIEPEDADTKKQEYLARLEPVQFKWEPTLPGASEGNEGMLRDFLNLDREWFEDTFKDALSKLDTNIDSLPIVTDFQS